MPVSFRTQTLEWHLYLLLILSVIFSKAVHLKILVSKRWIISHNITFSSVYAPQSRIKALPFSVHNLALWANHTHPPPPPPPHYLYMWDRHFKTIWSGIDISKMVRWPVANSMITNMTGLRWFLKNFASMWFGQKKLMHWKCHWYLNYFRQFIDILPNSSSAFAACSSVAHLQVGVVSDMLNDYSSEYC